MTEAKAEVIRLEKYIHSLTIEQELMDIVEPLIGLYCPHYYFYIKINGNDGIIINKDSIEIYIPNANRTWFFEIMRLAEAICNTTKFTIYPQGDRLDKNKIVLRILYKNT